MNPTEKTETPPDAATSLAKIAEELRLLRAATIAAPILAKKSDINPQTIQDVFRTVFSYFHGIGVRPNEPAEPD